MRKLLALVAVPALFVPLASSASADDDPAVQSAATKTVRVGDNFFRPKSLTVKKRTIVRWVWGTGGQTETDQEHNVRGTKGNKFASSVKTKGSFRKRITKTTSIICDVHPTTMKMKIKVKK